MTSLFDKKLNEVLERETPHPAPECPDKSHRACLPENCPFAHTPPPAPEECGHKKALRKNGITPPEEYICRACEPSAPADEWETFVSFIRPFKNRDYTEDTAKEIERRAALLLKHQATQLIEKIEGMKDKSYENYCGDECVDKAFDAVLSELKKLI